MFKSNVEDLWNLENIEIKPKEKGEKDDFVMDWFKGTISRKDKRYFVSWPWREENEFHLPENFELSLGRLKSLIKRIEKNPDLLEKYNNVIQEQIANSVIERVESSEEDNENGKHYIPHHAVITPEKATATIRIVERKKPQRMLYRTGYFRRLMWIITKIQNEEDRTGFRY